MLVTIHGIIGEDIIVGIVGIVGTIGMVHLFTLMHTILGDGIITITGTIVTIHIGDMVVMEMDGVIGMETIITSTTEVAETDGMIGDGMEIPITIMYSTVPETVDLPNHLQEVL
jgi:hypothetical protein